MVFKELQQYRAKRLHWEKYPKEEQWIEGFIFPKLYDGIFVYCIGDEPLSANDYGEISAENRDWFYVDQSTISAYSGMTDCEGTKIYRGDVVELFGMRGLIVFNSGSYGIAFENSVDWDAIKEGCDYSSFTYNDNFIPLWELAWNFDREGNDLDMVKVVTNIYDNMEALHEKSTEPCREEYGE